jgi:hypothetical protein
MPMRAKASLRKTRLRTTTMPESVTQRWTVEVYYDVYNITPDGHHCARLRRPD